MKADPPRIVPFDPSRSDRAVGEIPDLPDDPELMALFRKTGVPAPSETLDARVLASYRAAVARRSLWKARLLPTARGGRSRTARGLMLGAAAALLLTIYVAWGDRHPLSAAALLNAAVTADAELFGHGESGTHRVFSFETVRLSDGAVETRGRVEIWDDAAQEVHVRRLFDAGGTLIAGAWRRSTSSTLYRAGEPPAPLDTNDLTAARAVWAWEATAKAFAALSQDATLSIEDRGAQYVLSATPTAPDGVIDRATLIIAKRSRRSIGATLRLRASGRRYEHRWAEVSLHRVPMTAIEASAFEPDAALTTATPPIAPTPAPVRSTILSRPIVDTHALDTLEMTMWHALNRLGLSLGDEARVDRDHAGSIGVHITVSGELRRSIVERGLAELASEPRVAVELRSEPERQAPSITASVAAPGTAALTRALLRAAPELTPDVLAELTRQTAEWALSRGRIADARAAALDRFTTRWASDAVVALDLDTQAKWQQIIRQHIFDIGQEAEALGARLAPMLTEPPQPGSRPVVPLAEQAEAFAAIQRILTLERRQSALLTEAFTTPATDAWSPEPLSSVFKALQSEALRFTGPWPLGGR